MVPGKCSCHMKLAPVGCRAADIVSGVGDAFSRFSPTTPVPISEVSGFTPRCRTFTRQLPGAPAHAATGDPVRGEGADAVREQAAPRPAPTPFTPQRRNRRRPSFPQPARPPRWLEQTRQRFLVTRSSSGVSLTATSASPPLSPRRTVPLLGVPISPPPERRYADRQRHRATRPARTQVKSWDLREPRTPRRERPVPRSSLSIALPTEQFAGVSPRPRPAPESGTRAA